MPVEQKHFMEYLKKMQRLKPRYVWDINRYVNSVLNDASLDRIVSPEDLSKCISAVSGSYSKQKKIRRHSALQHYVRFIDDTNRIRFMNLLKNYLTYEEECVTRDYRCWLRARKYSHGGVKLFVSAVKKYFYRWPLKHYPLGRKLLEEFRIAMSRGKFITLSAFIRFLEQKNAVPPRPYRFKMTKASDIPQEVLEKFKNYVEENRHRYCSRWGGRVWGFLVNFGLSLAKQEVSDLGRVTRQLVSEFLRPYREKNVSASHINGLCLEIAKFYEWCADEYGWQIQPVSRKYHYMKMTRGLPRPLRDNDIRLLKKHLPDNWFRLAFYLALEAGLRRSEVLNLRLQEIDLNAVKITVINGKGSKDRIVYISPLLCKEIRRWLKRRQRVRECYYLFHNHGHVRSGRSINCQVSKLSQSSSVIFTFHQLRHTFCTRLGQQGMKLECRMKLMGHARPETTMGYTQIDNQEVRQAFLDAKREEIKKKAKEVIHPTELGSIRDVYEKSNRGEIDIKRLFQ